MTDPTLPDLIARAESAPPEQERALLTEGWRAIYGMSPAGTMYDCGVHGTRPGHLDRKKAESFTAKLDANAGLCAAMMLVEAEDRWPQISYMAPNPNNSRQGHRVRLDFKGGKSVMGRSQSSFAIALLSARLKQEMQDG